MTATRQAAAFHSMYSTYGLLYFKRRSDHGHLPDGKGVRQSRVDIATHPVNLLSSIYVIPGHSLRMS
jgi:hypothetical protein